MIFLFSQDYSDDGHNYSDVMKSSMENRSDFTSDSIFSKLTRFMFPILGVFVLHAMYGAVDVMIIGLVAPKGFPEYPQAPFPVCLWHSTHRLIDCSLPRFLDPGNVVIADVDVISFGFRKELAQCVCDIIVKAASLIHQTVE